MYGPTQSVQLSNFRGLVLFEIEAKFRNQILIWMNDLSAWKSESSWRNLSDLHSFAPLRTQKLSEILAWNFVIFQEKSPFVAILAETWLNFVAISRIIRKLLQNEENLKQILKKLVKSWTWVGFELDLSWTVGPKIRSNSELDHT